MEYSIQLYDTVTQAVTGMLTPNHVFTLYVSLEGACASHGKFKKTFNPRRKDGLTLVDFPFIPARVRC